MLARPRQNKEYRFQNHERNFYYHKRGDGRKDTIRYSTFTIFNLFKIEVGKNVYSWFRHENEGNILNEVFERLSG